ncbi:MAG: sigma-70 family RNA polymerase sigma factor [Mariniblastus sp.]
MVKNNEGEFEFLTLLEQARHGDAVATGRLLQHHRNYLLLIANQELDSVIAQKFGASDIVQESLLTAHQQFGRFQGKEKKQLVAWLRQILINDLNQARRTFKGTQKRQVDREQPLQSSSSHVRPLVDQELTPQTNALAVEQRCHLRLAIAALPADYQKVIELHSFDKMEFSEIGKIMERSSEACQKLWTRAVLKLRDHWGQMT